MTAILHTSTGFASAIAEGADWREVGRSILEALESIRTPDDGMNIGFLYATTPLNADFHGLVSLVKHVTHIDHWFGATGTGICGNGKTISDRPAAVAMIGRLPPGSIHPFHLRETGEFPPALLPWLADHPPSAAVTHGGAQGTIAAPLAALSDKASLYTIGGLSPPDGLHLCEGTIHKEGLSGVVLSNSINIMTALSQGCTQAGPVMRITACRDNVIEAIDNKPAAAALHEAIKCLSLPQGESRTGAVHVAFPVSGADTGALLVRNVTAMDEKARTLTVAQRVERGDPVQFVYRDRQTASADLAKVLKGLHKRASGPAGAVNLAAKGMLYFSCIARIPHRAADDEAALIRQVFGDIPMAGIYTGGEICNGQVHGYTGIPLLFL